MRASQRKQEPHIPFIWDGDIVNLGRFGAVNPGDTLLLTDDEADSVKDDQRYLVAADIVRKAEASGNLAKVPQAALEAVEKFLGVTLRRDALVKAPLPPDKPLGQEGAGEGDSDKAGGKGKGKGDGKTEAKP